MNNMAKQATDLWLLNPDGTPDPFAANVKWDMPDLPDPDEPLPEGDLVTLDSHDGLQPDVVVVEGGVPKQPPAPPEPVVEIEPDEPEVMDLEDGTQLVLEKDKGWWVGSVVGQAGSAQRYKGATKNKLILEVLKAQANATKKIREQNTKLKFGTAPVAKPVPPQTPAPVIKTLSADEIFEFKTQLDSNPELAFDTYFQKKTGLTVQQLVELAQQGARAGSQAQDTLYAEQVTKTFLQNNPDYYSDPQWENYGSLVKWLMKFKLGESVRKGEEEAAFNRLISSRTWNVENLEEAFADLSDSQLLVLAPRQPKPSPPVVVEEPVPAPRPDSRIVSQVTRPRAAYGIRPSDVTPVAPPATPKAPSAEDLESLSDEEISKLFSGVRRLTALQGRRN